MKRTVNFSQFCDEFTNHERQENFSYEGKKALFNYLEELEQDTGKEIELDVIALCCEYTEYADIEEFNDNYDIGAETLDDIRYHTQVIDIDGISFIIQNF